MNSSKVKIFQYDDGKTEIQVKLDKETVWLSQKQMAELFEKDTDTIGLHIKYLQIIRVGRTSNYRGILGSSN